MVLGSHAFFCLLSFLLSLLWFSSLLFLFSLFVAVVVVVFVVVVFVMLSFSFSLFLGVVVSSFLNVGAYEGFSATCWIALHNVIQGEGGVRGWVGGWGM